MLLYYVFYKNANFYCLYFLPNNPIMTKLTMAKARAQMIRPMAA